jgi:hypothetical protein
VSFHEDPRCQMSSPRTQSPTTATSTRRSRASSSQPALRRFPHRRWVAWHNRRGASKTCEHPCPPAEKNAKELSSPEPQRSTTLVRPWRTMLERTSSCHRARRSSSCHCSIQRGSGHCPLGIARWALPAACRLSDLPNRSIQRGTGHGPLCIARCALPVVHCPLCIARCALPVVHCLLPIASRTCRIARCRLFSAQGAGRRKRGR